MNMMAILLRAATAASLAAIAPLSAQPASRQSIIDGCASERTANSAQTLHCDHGVTIVAEDGAQFQLKDRDRNGEVDAVDLHSKALLLEAPTQRAGRRFVVTTPQAIAAVRGTRWAVDAGPTTTSILVLGGQVTVRGHAGNSRVVLGPGEGVDVAGGAEPLAVKRWPQARVGALLARLGQ